MKKNILTFFLSLTLYVLCSTFSNSFAQTKSPTPPSPTQKQKQNQLEEQINNLKDRIASRVAQLKLVERRGIIGIVTSVSDTQFTISDIHEATRFVDVDELTKFASDSANASFGISDITKGTKVGVLGLYNKQSRRVLGRFVDVLKTPQAIHGTILSLDSKKFQFKIAADDGKTYTIDVLTTTKTNSYTKEGGMVKSGFSKLSGEQRIIVRGFPDAKDPTFISASRILVFPELPKNPKIQTSKKDTTTSTESGEEVTQTR